MSVVFLHDSKLLALISSYDKTARIWDTSTGSLQQTLKGYNSKVMSIVFSHDSKLLALALNDRTVKI
jgi:WD40 repeat protein